MQNLEKVMKFLQKTAIFVMIMPIFASQNGIFLTAELGLHAARVYQEDASASGSVMKNGSSTTTQIHAEYIKGGEYNFNPTFGARVGYLKFFGAHGFRISTGANFTNVTILDHKNFKKFLINAGISTDYLLSFGQSDNSFGMFLGGGFDAAFGDFVDHFKKSQQSTRLNFNQPFVNFGFFKGLDGAQILEVGMKIPFGRYADYPGGRTFIEINGEKITGKFNIATASILYARYSYIFSL